MGIENYVPIGNLGLMEICSAQNLDRLNVLFYEQSTTYCISGSEWVLENIFNLIDDIKCIDFPELEVAGSFTYYSVLIWPL